MFVLCGKELKLSDTLLRLSSIFHTQFEPLVAQTTKVYTCIYVEKVEKVWIRMDIFTVHEMYLTGFDYIFVRNTYIRANT